MSCTAALLLGLHLATAHMGPGAHEMRTATPGVYAQADCGLTVGAYRNSVGRPSAYAGWTWSSAAPTQAAGLSWAITAGTVTGYPGHRLLPLLVPSLRLPLADGMALRLGYLPKPPKLRTVAGVHAALEVTLP